MKKAYLIIVLFLLSAGCAQKWDSSLHDPVAVQEKSPELKRAVAYAARIGKVNDSLVITRFLSLIAQYETEDLDFIVYKVVADALEQGRYATMNEIEVRAKRYKQPATP